MTRESESGAGIRVDRSSVVVRGAIVSSVVVGVSAAAALTAASLIARRWFFDAEPFELSVARLRLAGFAVAGYAWAAHWAWRRVSAETAATSSNAELTPFPRFAKFARQAAVWLALVYLGSFCESFAEGVRVVGPALAVELTFGWGWRARGTVGHRRIRGMTPARQARSQQSESAGMEVAERGRLSQSLVRGVDQAGEFVEGETRIEFSVGERTATTHVSFCPPLESPPRITAQRVRGAAASVTVGQAEIFGARFDVRLDRVADEPQTVVVRYAARAASGATPTPTRTAGASPDSG